MIVGHIISNKLDALPIAVPVFTRESGSVPRPEAVGWANQVRFPPTLFSCRILSESTERNDLFIASRRDSAPSVVHPRAFCAVYWW